MANKYQFGLSNFHYAFLSEDGSWEKPVPIPGIVNCNKSPNVSSMDFYADNVLYAHEQNDMGDSIEVEMALFPDSFKARALGWRIDGNGALVRVSGGRPEKFAVMYQVQGDVKNRRKVVYECFAALPTEAATTKGESLEVSTESMTITSTPHAFGEELVVEATLNQGDEGYDSAFEQVYVPAASDQSE